MPKSKPKDPAQLPLPSAPVGRNPEEGDQMVKPHISQKKIDKASAEGRAVVISGELSAKVIESIANEFGPQKVVDKMKELLEATKTMAVGGRPFETPDFKTQLDALKVLLQYQVGMPVARTESVVHNMDTMDTLEHKMQSSPALRRAVGRMLDQAEVQDGKIVEASSEPLSDEEMADAKEALQSAPEQGETPIEAEVVSRKIGDSLITRSELDVEDKYVR